MTHLVTHVDFEVTGSKVTGALTSKNLSAQLLKNAFVKSLHIWYSGWL
jgi:hypothetical protein